MSTKARIQKVRAEVEAHEERGWLKGYEEGLAVREQQIVEAQAALESRKKTIREMREAMKKRNEVSSAPTTAREALALAWELAHPVNGGDVIPKNLACLQNNGECIETKSLPTDWTPAFPESVRTLEPLPETEPEPDWLDAPAVLASVKDEDNSLDRQIFARLPGGRWAGRYGNWETYETWELTDVTPLYPKEGQDK